MRFLLKLENYNADISKIEYDVDSGNENILEFVHEKFEELFKYDLSYLWEEPYEPIIFNMGMIYTDGNEDIVIYSDSIYDGVFE